MCKKVIKFYFGSFVSSTQQKSSKNLDAPNTSNIATDISVQMKTRNVIYTNKKHLKSKKKNKKYNEEKIGHFGVYPIYKS